MKPSKFFFENIKTTKSTRICFYLNFLKVINKITITPIAKNLLPSLRILTQPNWKPLRHFLSKNSLHLKQKYFPLRNEITTLRNEHSPSAKSEINNIQSQISSLSTGMKKNYIDDFKNSLLIEIGDLKNHSTNSLFKSTKSEIENLRNSLSTSVHNEIDHLKNSLSTISNSEFSVCNEIGLLRETIEPEINRITNISKSLETAVEVKFDKLEISLLQSKESLANLSKNVEFLYLRMLPKSCVEALQNGGESGVYKLYLSSSGLDPFHVYCLKDPENGHAWTVVQRRQDGSVDFYRNWEEYKNGFGDLNGEYFIGLEKLHALTNQAIRQKLWIQLGDWEGQSKSVTYTDFQIGNEDSKYALTKIGGHSGDFYNTLHSHRGMKFSTKDSDNDIDSTRNCAVKFTGAWWFHQCHTMHLNGVYHHANPVELGQGVANDGWHGEYYSSKYAHMAIRPVS